MARVYDLETKRLYDVPDAELAPGMIEAQVSGIDGTVWVDASQLKPGEMRHPPFSGELRHYIREIKRVFDEVYPQTLEEWEDGFRRDAHPEREISLWLHMGRVFLQVTEGRMLDIAQRKDHFRVLLACSNSPREQVMNILTLEAITRHEAEETIELFYSRHGGGGA